jgi:hypothetical protein
MEMLLEIFTPDPITYWEHYFLAEKPQKPFICRLFAIFGGRQNSKKVYPPNPPH